MSTFPIRSKSEAAARFNAPLGPEECTKCGQFGVKWGRWPDGQAGRLGFMCIYCGCGTTLKLETR